jgi:hypothetical protein
LRRYATFLRHDGELERSVAALAEAQNALEKLPEDKAQQAELSNVLYYTGVMNSDRDMLGLGRPAVAMHALETSVGISRKLMAADQQDHGVRIDFVQAELWLAQLLAKPRPSAAMPLFDEAWDVMRGEPDGSFLRNEYMIRGGAESTFALRSLGRESEARQRLDRIRAMFFANQDPQTMRIGPFNPIEAFVRAQAEVDAAAGRLPKAIETYRLLLQKFADLRYHPRDSLIDALAQSTKEARLAELLRLSGDRVRSRQYAESRLELWRHWNQRLPQNSYVMAQLSDAEHSLSAVR